MDIRMPDMDGSEATRRIRDAATLDPRTANHKPIIIALTASAFEEDRLAIMASGCDDFLRKPYRNSDLFRLMAKHLGVRFIYETHTEETPARSEEADKDILDSKRINALPGEWVADLRKAALRTDLKWANKVIHRIRKQDDPLAEALARVVGKYRFDIIQDLVKEA